MKVLIALLMVTLAGLCWLQHENSLLRDAVDKANHIARDQTLKIDQLKTQFSVVSDRADENERVQVSLRERLNEADEREAMREKTITGLLNENEAFRRWYGAVLPDAVRRLHRRPACVSAGHCLQRLPESEPMSDARK
ncbi:LysB family phage lysis regulatory protein [Cronobacter malonaticus]